MLKKTNKKDIIVSLYTGLRIGELCALKWEDIFDGKIAVTKTMQRIKQDAHTKIEIMPPKTESSNRIIPMPEQLIPYVENQRKESGYFLQRDNGDFTEPRLLQMKFKRYTEECGIPSMNFHALRRTYATRCMESGVDVKTLSELLGHRDIKTTLNKYVHSSMEQKVSSVNRLKII